MPSHHQNPFVFRDVQSQSLLLVEGSDDAKFFDSFLKNGLGKQNIQIARVGSKDKFRPFLTGTLKNAENFPNLRRLGIIRDADTASQSTSPSDTGAANALKSLQGALCDAGMPVPPRRLGARADRQYDSIHWYHAGWYF